MVKLQEDKCREHIKTIMYVFQQRLLDHRKHKPREVLHQNALTETATMGLKSMGIKVPITMETGPATMEI